MLKHRAKKSLGQNFLQDQNIQKKIVSQLDSFSADHLLEIGPGFGALTKHLLKRDEKLTVVEYDRDIVNYWQKEKAAFNQLLHLDILKTKLDQIFSLNEQNIIIGNIPYNITSPILFHILNYRSYVLASILMMQKEVAERLIAKQNSKAYGILSVIFQFYAEINYEFSISKKAFQPAPKVESALISIRFKRQIDEAIDHDFFRFVVRKAFNQRRKMLRSSLKSLLEERNYSIDLTRRPESLSPDEFLQLSKELKKNDR